MYTMHRTDSCYAIIVRSSDCSNYTHHIVFCGNVTRLGEELDFVDSGSTCPVRPCRDRWREGAGREERGIGTMVNVI